MFRVNKVLVFISGFVIGISLTWYAGIQEKPKDIPVETPISQILKDYQNNRPRVEVSRGYINRDITEITLELTAYTANDPGMDGKGITRSGLPVDVGVIAVDPKIIPLGTIVWVPNVGYLVALDTGGAIKGYRGDLYMPSREEALKWGRRKVTVKIIGRMTDGSKM